MDYVLKSLKKVQKVSSLSSRNIQINWSYYETYLLSEETKGINFFVYRFMIN